MTIRVGDGEIPVLLIHASGSGAKQMEQIARLLVTELQTLQVWIPELSGYGGVATPGLSSPIDQHLSILENITTELSRPCFIVGHSMGGFLGLKLASSLSTASNTNRVLGVVAIEPMAFGMLAEPRDHAVRQQDRDVLARMQALINAGQAESGIAAFIEYWNQTPWSAIPPPVRKALTRMTAQISAEAAAVSMDTTTAYPISAPVHLVCGENSPPPAQRIIERLAEALASASVEQIAGAGHMSLLRQPEKYLAGIVGLISENSRSSQTRRH